MSELTTVKMHIRPETLDLVNELHSRLGTATKTDALVKAVKISLKLLDDVDQGSIILLQKPNGDRDQLFIR